MPSLSLSQGVAIFKHFFHFFSFFLSWLMAKQLLCGMSALEDSDNRRRYLYDGAICIIFNTFLCGCEEIKSHYLLLNWTRGWLGGGFQHVCPVKQKQCWFCSCSLRLADRPEGAGKLRNIRLQSLPFTCFLIGLFHLARASTCLLGMLQLKYHIKRMGGAVILERVHASNWKSQSVLMSLCEGQ